MNVGVTYWVEPMTTISADDPRSLKIGFASWYRNAIIIFDGE